MTTFNDKTAKTLWIVLGINFGFFILEVLTGVMFASLGVVADGIDMLLDGVGYGLSIVAVTRCACFKKKVANFSGVVLTLSAIGGLVMIAYRFFSPEIPNYMGMAIISALAFIGNYISLYLLQKIENKSSNIKASVICSSKDCLVNLGVIISAVLVWIFDSQIPDLIMGAIIFVFVIHGAKEIFNLKQEPCKIHNKK